MHGIIHTELQKYIEANHGSDALTAILKEAGLSNKIYMAINTYPDEEALAIVNAASLQTFTTAEDIFEDFGEFIVPELMGIYLSLIKPEWKTRELLLHTEETIHRVVRMKNPGAKPPRLQFEEMGPNMLRLTYTSPRRMSALAKGIIKGVAKYYRETVNIQEHKRDDGSSEMLIIMS